MDDRRHTTADTLVYILGTYVIIVAGLGRFNRSIHPFVGLFVSMVIVYLAMRYNAYTRLEAIVVEKLSQQWND